jgi:hypothetical protein
MMRHALYIYIYDEMGAKISLSLSLNKR